MTRAGVLVVVILVALVGVVVARWPQEGGGLRAWIAEVRDGDDDWGWDLLSAEAQGAYAGDRDAYVADMSGVDWGALDIGDPIEAWSDDSVARLEAELRSDPMTVPAFLFARRIVHGGCNDNEPTSIYVYEDRRPFQGGIGGGGVTGSQAECNAAFTRDGSGASTRSPRTWLARSLSDSRCLEVPT